jgi:ribose 5-phosphate isomerase B
MAMAANKVRGIRAALVWSPAEARAARHEDDANILVIPSDFVDPETALTLTDDFLKEPFSGQERHRRRLKQIERLYG